MTEYEVKLEAIKRATKDLPPRYRKGDLRNIKRMVEFMERYDKSKKEILEEEHD